MIEIEMSEDIRNFSPKIIGPLSIRQLIAAVIGVGLALPAAIFIPLDLEFRILIAVLIAAPAIVCGFFKFYGMAPEVFFIRVMIPFYLNPEKRLYQSVPLLGGVPAETKKTNEKKKPKVRYRSARPRK